MHGELGKLAVTWLAGDERAAIARRLAGLFLDGGADSPALRRAARQELADDLVFRREAERALAALAGQRPVVLKGRMLAEACWPKPQLRPAGDLDLLVGEDELASARAALEALGYRAGHSEPPSRLRAQNTSVELIAPAGGQVTVDLHTRVFRSVGSGIDPSALIARARPAELFGQPVRELEPADRLLFVAVHAAKHAVRSLKWLLDLHALAAVTDENAWATAIDRARSTGTARPFWAALRLVDEARVHALAPPAPWRALLERLITVEGAVRGGLRGWEGYALEVALEPSLRRRARMALGLAERLLGTFPRV